MLDDDELVVIADPDPGFRLSAKEQLEKQGLASVAAGTADELFNILSARRVALVFLATDLPGSDLLSLLSRLANQHQRTTVIIVICGPDRRPALAGADNGATDYLVKPVLPEEIVLSLRKTLERRFLVSERFRYRQALDDAQFRIRLLYQLSLKMNSAYLSTVELDRVLYAILVGITAAEGLRFNRAFLAMFDADGLELRGRMAIGAGSREEAGRVWAEMRDRNMDFLQIVNGHETAFLRGDAQVNRMIRSLAVPVSDAGHILIKSAFERKSIRVTNGRADCQVAPGLIELLGEDSFVVVPLYSPGRALGVIIADNFVNREQITDDLISALELFSSQASLAVEQSYLHMDMQKKIIELQDLTQELDKSRDLLVEAERFSALGHMAAQLVHSIRNPVTSIGGMARILARRTLDRELEKFLDVIVTESAKLESTMQDLFDFVHLAEVQKEIVPLYPLIRKTVILFRAALEKQAVICELELPEQEPVFGIDVKQMRQVFIHLFKNAVEAMPRGGKLVITVWQDSEWVSIRISDTGTGMPDADMARAKDPFFTTKTYGTGMGLTLVERIVNAHNGRLSLGRRPEGGTQVRVDLPLNG